MTEPATPLTLVPGKTDAEMAAELRKDMVDALGPVLDVMTKAYKEHFEVTFALGVDYLGRAMMQGLTVKKVF